jgi:cobalt-zinc-cadmium efflux system outer membrane protein
MPFYKTCFVLVAAAIAGCVSVPRDGDFAAVQQLVDERIPQQVHWYQGGAEDEAVEKALDELLAEPLTTRAAVQIALLNNRRLQAEYENLGVAQADLVQAGLLSNPVLFASARFPHGGGRANTEFDLFKDFLDILLLPARQRLAAAEFERAKLRVANVVLDLAAEVMTAFHKVQGAARLVEMLSIVNESAQASYELAQRFEAAGNLSERQLAQERSAAAETRAELVRARAEFQAARDEVNRLLGLTSPARDWMLGEPLPELPAADPDPDAAESIAVERRLDLAEVRKEIGQLTDALDITRSYRFIGGAVVGVNSERDTGGTHVTGPNFSVELPIFDQRQAEIARLESLIRQSEARAAALETEIRAEVRTVLNRVSAARTLVAHYRDEVVPAGEQVVKFTQQEQNYMLVDVFELLFALRQVRAAYRGYIEAVRDYWVARAKLLRAAGGGSLPEAAAPGAMNTATELLSQFNPSPWMGEGKGGGDGDDIPPHPGTFPQGERGNNDPLPLEGENKQHPPP